MSVTILEGDCLESVAMLPATIDACVTDPPYHFGSIVKRFSKSGGSDRPESKVGAYARHAKGFMGKTWDAGDIAFRPETWRVMWDAMKPGAHLAAFGGTRGFHRMFCAIEDAGFEIRDTLMWVYGQGFPKSHNQHDEWEGWGTALKPAWEPIGLFRKPLIGSVANNLAEHRTGAINIRATRVEGREIGRWPANVLHDGSDDAVAAFPDSKGQQGALTGNEPSPTFSGAIYGKMARSRASTPRGDSGSAARFFYCAKASKADRCESKHPTVKPVALMQWLCRLVTPPGGTVLDPFAGSGTTGQAALAEGFSVILCERETEYVADIRRRLGLSVMSETETAYAELVG